MRVTDRVTGQCYTLGSYATEADAHAAGHSAATDQQRGAWVPPDRGKRSVGEYVAEWVAGNRRITSPRTRERYESLLRCHLAPHLGDVELGALTPEAVRRWHTTLTRTASAATAAKAYCLLRAAYNTAVRDELVVRNPCKVDGGGIERPAERPTASVAEVAALADAVPARWRLLVLLAAYTSLRFGDLAALTRADVDVLRGTLNVTRNRQRLDDGTSVTIDPKSAAGRRKVAYPPPLRPAVEHHLATYAAPGADGLVFVGEHGAGLDRSHWGNIWRKARAEIGREDLRFHDLRHTGNTLAAATGASTKQLMARMGHASMRAALIYQHATEDADQAIAEGAGPGDPARARARPRGPAPPRLSSRPVQRSTRSTLRAPT